MTNQVASLGGRVLGEDVLLSEAPAVEPPHAQFGKFAGLVTQSGAWN
jgi:hypothetical protein